MKISLPVEHKSLSPFTIDNLPNFVLLTGKNGAGKSQLLEAIRNGIAQVSVDGRTLNGAVLLNQNTLLQPSEMQSLEDLEHRIGSAHDEISEKRKLLDRYASEFDLPGSVVQKFWMNGYDHAIRDPIFTGNGAKDTSLINHFNTWHSSALFRLLYGKSVGPGALTQEDIRKASLPVSPLFSNPVLDAFHYYWTLVRENSYNEFLSTKSGNHIPHLTEDEFRTSYGPPPWDIMNDAMQNIGLDFVVTAPNVYSKDFVAPTFQTKSGKYVSPEEFSSGEKILLALAVCTYRDRSIFTQTALPSIILLDEVDAPLHPEMTRTYLNIIRTLLVGKLNAKVIATTHSPSTLAMAFPEPVFLMRRRPFSIENVNVDRALNELTAGVPNLSLSFDGRRQVLCENHTDAQVYSKLYESLKSRNWSSRSLQFLGTGLSDPASINEGCAVVRKLVKTLNANGATSIFGIVDWDGKAKKNASYEKIFVMGEGLRDGLENVLFDPLLLASMIIYGDDNSIRRLINPEGATAADFRRMKPSELQVFVQRIQELIFGTALSSEPSLNCRYIGGFDLSISQHFLADDHRLGDIIVPGKIGQPSHFISYSKERGSKGQANLMHRIAANVAREFPEFVPIDVERAFRAILDA